MIRSLRELTPEDEWWDGGKQVGYCDSSGNIRISLLDLKGKPYKISFILDTLAHELAHLRQLSHDKAWKTLYLEIKRKITVWRRQVGNELSKI